MGSMEVGAKLWVTQTNLNLKVYFLFETHSERCSLQTNQVVFEKPKFGQIVVYVKYMLATKAFLPQGFALKLGVE